MLNGENNSKIEMLNTKIIHLMRMGNDSNVIAKQNVNCMLCKMFSTVYLYACRIFSYGNKKEIQHLLTFAFFTRAV